MTRPSSAPALERALLGYADMSATHKSPLSDLSESDSLFEDAPTVERAIPLDRLRQARRTEQSQLGRLVFDDDANHDA
jgi:hypothetical protein